MAAERSWWRDASDREDRARWLGLIPRPVRLALSQPERRVEDRPAPELARRLEIAEPELLLPGRHLAMLPELGEARRLDASLRRPSGAPAGRVGLAGILLDDEPAPNWWDAQRAEGEGVLEERPFQEREVPLWRRLAIALQLPTYLLLDQTGPVEWPRPLFPYQLDGVRALLQREALLLADDMGLGKTIQALAALRIMVLQNRVERALVVAPAGLLAQWREAAATWAPELRVSTVRGPAVERVWQWRTPAHVHLVSYDTLRADTTANPSSPPRRQTWDVVILDEAQRAKNPESDVHRACKRLPRRRTWALTGTPLENSIDDLAAVLELVRGGPDDPTPPGMLAGAALRERQREVQLRRRRADVLPDLPPKTVTRIPLTLTGRQRESYERAEREGVVGLRERGAQVRVENVIELIVRLKQLCNADSVSGRSAKLDDLAERMETLNAEGHRALIFTQFVDDRHGARAIARRLQALRPLLYTGELTATEREAVVARFRDHPEHGALILSLQAGAEGLNLQAASYVFHFDRWWNPARERQAEGRSHRLGQTAPVHVYTYVCEDTIEERIDAVLASKQRLFDEVVDGVSLDLTASLDRDELFGLFNLPPPPRRP
ncbi:MAG: DEAD/DEAH box helicase [Chloroflexota bacterium]